MALQEKLFGKDVRENEGSANRFGRIELEQVAAPGEGGIGPSRRDFLKLAGFAFAGTVLAGCERAPVQYAIPYLTPPDEIIPGRSYHYASTCGGCSAGCGLLVKNRDGRPIKLEGNREHPLSRGGLCAAGQASLLGLYDQQRLHHPLQAGQPAEWAAVDQGIMLQLDAIRKRKGAVRFLSGPGVSPTTRSLLRRFLDTFANGRHIIHDPRSCSAILEAHGRTHGIRLLPHYHLEKAEVIVSFDADFLGTWISPVESTAAYQTGRRLEGPEPRLSYHVQFESLLSLTGTKADRRFCIAPPEMGAAMNHLAARLANKAGVIFQEDSAEKPPVSGKFLDHLADYLWRNRSRSLVMCGSQDLDLQLLCNFLNHVLGNYGTTVDVVQPSYQREGDDLELETLLQELHEDKVGALLIYQCNPVHDLPSGDHIAECLKRVPLVVSLGSRLDETARLAGFVCPDHHYLESWSDAEPINGLVSLVQPAIAPLGKTRSALESLAAWTPSPYPLPQGGGEGKRTVTVGSTVHPLPPCGGEGWVRGTGMPRAAYDLLREHWEKEVFPRQIKKATFQEFWDRTLHDGFVQVKPRQVKVGAFSPNSVRPVPSASATPPGTYTLILYSKAAMPDASHGYNPWLHELPDPISKIVWDNYACLSPAAAADMHVSDGDVVRLENDQGRSLELPVFVQAGLHDRVVAVALGYGSVLSQRFANIGPPWLQARPTVGTDGLVGKNAASFLSWARGSLRFTQEGVRLTKTGREQPLASTQGFSSVEVPKHLALPGQEIRPIIRETTVAAYSKEDPLETCSPAVSDHRPSLTTHHSPLTKGEEDFWPADHPTAGYHWGMVIDLNACTGCSACVLACQAENNIPVVGKDEVRRHREMHWLRIDSYYSEREGSVDVAHQPMLCQHCGNAPCEVVCPVLATVHSEEGLNQQVYNRCVGTRYCANNCPYKVRRFNWFDYAHDDLLQNLVLNPDVTVRSRGVMEKCTFCVQRIEEAKIESHRQGQPLRDGDIQTACQQSCPAQAIVFGNLKDPRSRVARMASSRRGYQVLGELNVRPSVTYLTLVRNRPAAGEGEKHG
jgi:molybdopterin-containing oxidoreductase family iron-sulfur binding subunit